MVAPILSVDGLHKDYGGVRAVDLSLAIEPGELRCLIGPNGAGKSTLFKILSGVIRPSRGSVHFRGREITNLDAFRVARLGISIKFQTPSVFERLTVVQHLTLAAERRFGHAEGKERALRMLEAVGFGAIAQETAAALSHGQRQRLEIAMATIADPALVLLDEPTAGMSAEEVERAVDLVESLSMRATVIVVEHNMNFVRRIARRVTVMHEGKIFAEGTMAQIEANPAVRDIYLGKRTAHDARGF